MAFGSSGQFIRSIDRIRVFETETGIERLDIQYDKNPAIAHLFFPATAGGPPFLQGFSATPGSQAPPGVDLTVQIEATVMPGTTADQLSDEIEGAVLNTASITASGSLSDIRHASFTDISAEATETSVPVLSWWSALSVVVILLLIGLINLSKLQ